jgi:chromosome segregation ATPase
MTDNEWAFDRNELSRRAHEYEARERAERALLDDTVKRLVRRTRDLEKFLEEARRDTNDALCCVGQATEDATREREQADEAASQATRLEQTVSELRLALHDAELRVEHADAQANAAVSQVTQLDQTVSELRLALHDAESRVEHADAQAKAAVSQITQLEQTVSELRYDADVRVDRVEEQAKAAASQAIQLEQTVSELRLALHDADARVDHAEARVTEALALAKEMHQNVKLYVNVTSACNPAEGTSGGVTHASAENEEQVQQLQ